MRCLWSGVCGDEVGLGGGLEGALCGGCEEGYSEDAGFGVDGDL